MSKLMQLSVTQFKADFKCDAFTVLRNPKTGKLFVSTDNGLTFRCQGNISLAAPVQFIGEDKDNLCLVNIGQGAEVLATF
jgi:hypothetical protein